MKQVCKFKSGPDITPTAQGLGVDIPDSIDYFRIKDTSVPAQYNMQKQLSEVGSRIHEPFDVIEYDRTYTRIRSKVLKEKSEEKKDN